MAGMCPQISIVWRALFPWEVSIIRSEGNRKFFVREIASLETLQAVELVENYPFIVTFPPKAKCLWDKPFTLQKGMSEIDYTANTVRQVKCDAGDFDLNFTER